METFLFICIVMIASTVGAICAWSKFRHRVQRAELLPYFRAFIIHLWLVAIIAAMLYPIIPEEWHVWLVVPLFFGWLIAFVRLRIRCRQFYEAQEQDESH